MDEAPGIPRDVWDGFRPPLEIDWWDWLCENARSPDGKSKFNGDLVPWCRGVVQAATSGRWSPGKSYLEIVLQWAARTFKTGITHALLLAAAHFVPQPALLGAPTERLIRRHIKRKLYPMFEACKPLRGGLPPSARRSQYTLDYEGGYIQGAWAGSDTQLADFSARISAANEYDKWPGGESDEGDPGDQFHARSSEFLDRLNLKESTPTIRDRSRIERDRLQGTDSRFWVPCPHCRKFQILKWGTGDPRGGGVMWERTENGEQDIDRARDTARYVCEHCGKEISDHHKPRMNRQGEWAHRGQFVARGGKVQGTAVRDGKIWSSQLSGLYSLHNTWAELAARWVKSYRQTERRKAFVQLVLGECFEYGLRINSEDQLGERLRSEEARGVCPAWARCIVIACDVQAQAWPWLAVAYGEAFRCHVMDWGEEESWDDLRGVIQRAWPHRDGGPAQRACMVGVDSGGKAGKTLDTYKFCRTHRTPYQRVVALKGDDYLGGQPYREVRLGLGGSRARRAAAKLFRGEPLVHVCCQTFEAQIASQLDEIEPGQDWHLTLCRDASHDRTVLRQLLNATQAEETKKSGNTDLIWVKRWREEPNDLRDTLKYAHALAKLFVDGRGGTFPVRGGGLPPAAAAAIRSGKSIIRKPGRGGRGPIIRGRR